MTGIAGPSRSPHLPVVTTIQCLGRRRGCCGQCGSNRAESTKGSWTANNYVTPCQLPNAYERELLTILIEECAEVQQRATKLLRFGAAEVQPGQEKTNSERLANEIGDLVHMTTLLDRVGLISNHAVQAGMRNKQKQLAKFMQTRPEPPDNSQISLATTAFPK